MIGQPSKVEETFHSLFCQQLFLSVFDIPGNIQGTLGIMIVGNML